ncbi:MAG: hypothetical protein ACQEQK_05080, partial [Thermodesulfobacteriota bacterium]
MKAYTWLSVLILSVFAAGLLISRTLPVAPPPVHAKTEASHAECDHGHESHTTAEPEHPEHDEPVTPRDNSHVSDTAHSEHDTCEHGADATDPVSDHGAHEDPEPQCTGEDHSGHAHAAEEDAHAEDAEGDDVHVQDPHAGHAHAEAQ